MSTLIRFDDRFRLFRTAELQNSSRQGFQEIRLLILLDLYNHDMVQEDEDGGDLAV